MILRELFILVAAFAVISAPASAEEQAVEPQIIDFIADLEVGDREGAVQRISGVHGLSDRVPWVRTRGEFVDLVLGCDATLEKAAAVADWAFRMHDYSWDCDGKKFYAKIGKHPKNDYIEIADPADETHREKQLADRALPMVPMMPSRMPLMTPEERAAKKAKEDADRLAVLQDLEKALLANSFEGFENRLSNQTRFVLGYRDIAAKATIVDMDGNGQQAGQAQLDWVEANLGKVTSASCINEVAPATKELPVAIPMPFCRVRTDRPGHGYSGFVSSREGMLTSFQISYVDEKVFLLNRDELAKREAIQ